MELRWIDVQREHVSCMGYYVPCVRNSHFSLPLFDDCSISSLSAMDVNLLLNPEENSAGENAQQQQTQFIDFTFSGKTRSHAYREIVLLFEASIWAFGRKFMLCMLISNKLAYMFMVQKETLDDIAKKTSIIRRDAMNLANLHLLRYLENQADFAETPSFTSQALHVSFYKLVTVPPSQQPPEIVSIISIIDGMNPAMETWLFLYFSTSSDIIDCGW